MQAPLPLEAAVKNLATTSFFTDFPLFKHALYHMTIPFFSSPLSISEAEPDLLESATIFSKHLAAVSFTFSLLSLNLVPTICSALVVIVLKKTTKELFLKRRLVTIVSELENTKISLNTAILTLNREASASQKKLRTEIKQLSVTNKTTQENLKKLQDLVDKHTLTAANIAKLQKEEKELFTEHKDLLQKVEKIKKEFETVKGLFEKERLGIRKEREGLEKVKNELAQERRRIGHHVDRLSHLPQQKKHLVSRF